MTIGELRQRRSYYLLNKNLPVSEKEVISLIEEVTELVPDAFNMKSQRVAIVLGAEQDKLWDMIYDTFEGKVPRDKIDGFKAAAGTVLYFTDDAVVKAMQEQVAAYADNFPVWASQANGMLQINVWNALRGLNVCANIQHYNPVIDDVVKEYFNIPESWTLVAQMPFGGIAGEPDAKEKEAITNRVKVFK